MPIRADKEKKDKKVIYTHIVQKKAEKKTHPPHLPAPAPKSIPLPGNIGDPVFKAKKSKKSPQKAPIQKNKKSIQKYSVKKEKSIKPKSKKITKKKHVPSSRTTKKKKHVTNKKTRQSASSKKQRTGKSNQKGQKNKGALFKPGVSSKLFDSNVINKYAKNTKKSGKSNKKRGHFTFNVSNMKYRSYMQRLKASIEGAWTYPKSAARRGIYGDLYISFTILKNGRLGSVRVIRTSGHKSLDDAALKALRRAAPFWPLPNDWNMKSFTIKGHFVYSIYGNYIR